MSRKTLAAAEVGLPQFSLDPAAAGPGGADAAAEPLNLFQLSSHTRARQALAFALGVDTPGFNVFVLGEPNSGRMTATLQFLRNHVAHLAPADDWVYVNNFRRMHKPRRFHLPAGEGRRFKAALAAFVPAAREAVKQVLEAPEFNARLGEEQTRLNQQMAQGWEELQKMADAKGLALERGQQGLVVLVKDPEQGNRAWEAMSEAERETVTQASQEISERMAQLSAQAAEAGAGAQERIHALRRETAGRALETQLAGLKARYPERPGILRWLDEVREDILDHLGGFLSGETTATPAKVPGKPPGKTLGKPAPDDGDGSDPGDGPADDEGGRYAVNLFVDHADDSHPPVLLEPNPTYRRLFGTIEYRAVAGGFDTDTTMIRAGTLHRANGGVLVVRAEDLAREPLAYKFLKDALRDREIRIEEPQRQAMLPTAGAPEPKPIPLDLKVVIVGAPQLYYMLFSLDPEFQAQFKVKADIDPDIRADADNVATYARLIRAAAHQDCNCGCADDAIAYLLGQSARWAARRDKLTARFELIEAVLAEALVLARSDGDVDCDTLTAAHVKAAIEARRNRNARVEDRSQEQIADGMVMIDTRGQAVGQINALTVLDMGDHAFGRPARVTARIFVGKHGVINIERDVALGGPIQQKGVMILGGFLNGLFAQRFPLSFSCSITFEQSYGGVEGDSASMAELCAILSALAEVPIKQAIAMTGSVNQAGVAQVVGGVSHKIEGFYRACAEQGLTGEQGVVIPAANAINVTLRDEVRDAVAAGRFHIWTVDGVDDAMQLLTGIPARGDGDGPDALYAPETIYGRALARLTRFDEILQARNGHRD